MKNIAIVIVISMIIIHILGPEASLYGLYPGCPWRNHISYMFIHASWMHLLCNAWYLLDFSFRAKSLTVPMWCIAAFIAFAMPSATAIPVVGASGMLYALSGFLWIYSSDKWYFGSVFAAMTILQMLIGTTAVLFHLCCFASAIILALVLLPVYSKR